MTVRVFETQMIEIDLMDEQEENPNEMSDDQFSALVEEIAEHGWTVPVQVVGPKDDGRYTILGGHHRRKAAMVLGMDKVPAVVVPPGEYDRDIEKIQLVKQNVLHGQMNPEKFTDLFNEMAKKYDASMLQRMMAFTTTDAFNKVYLDAKKALPEGMQDKLEDVRDELKTIDDLSLVLNRLFTDYGESVQYHFMFFSYGGKSHAMVQLTAPGSWRRVKEFLEWCQENKKLADEELMARMNWPKPSGVTVVGDEAREPEEILST